MKYEIVMRSVGDKHEAMVTLSFVDGYMYGDLEYIRRCLAQCVFRTCHNGFKIAEYIYCNCNGHVMLCGFRTDGGQSYSIRKAVKQEKFNVKSQ